MAEHLAEAHEGHVAVVYDGPAAGGSGHEVAAEECEARVGVGVAQGSDELRGVEVAGGFAGYEEVVHRLRLLKKSCMMARHSSARMPKSMRARGWKGERRVLAV